MSVAIVIPVLKNFRGCVELMASIDHPATPVIIENYKYNHCVAHSWNIGIERANADHIIVCNDDIVFHPGTISKLDWSLTNRPDLDMVTGVSHPSDELGYGLNPDFACFAVRKNFLQKAGLFDENFKPAYFEDNDMARRMDLANLKYANRFDARITHAGSVTQNMGGPVCTSEKFEINRTYYIRKWGGEPGKETFSTPFNEPNNSIHFWNLNKRS